MIAVDLPINTKELMNQLIDSKPDAKKSLLASRVAINEEIVSLDHSIETVSDIYLLPPSSGG